MEDKFRTFLNQFNGKKVEKVDSSNYAQCFDLAIAWVEYLGLPTNIWSGLLYAYQIWTNPTQLSKDKFDFITNTSDYVPKTGDIIVWSNGYGSAGHVAIATGWFSDTNKFQAFSQNDPTGAVSMLKDYSYKFVLGGLRLKQSSDALSECLKLHADVLKQLEAQKKANSDLLIVNGKKDSEINSLKSDKDNLSRQLSELKQVNIALQSACDTKLAEASSNCLSEKKAIESKCANTIADYKSKLKNTNKGLLVLICEKLGL